MKQFFGVLFGGLFAVACGIAIAAGVVYSWRFVRPYIVSTGIISIQKISSAIKVEPDDGTSISGLKRTVRYSATEEEDLIDSAIKSLPKTSEDKITASAYILKDINTDQIKEEYNSEKILPIASVTKLVTAIVARRYIDQNTKVTISRDIMSTYGNTAFFQIGETFRVSDLMYPLLMVSSNDASEAIAKEFGRQRFIDAMNEFVQSIGAYRTYFYDPSGLSQKNISTAKDLVTILEWIRKNDPEIINITNIKSKTVRSHTWVNPTHFLSWSYYIGGKNGYTPEANRTSASLFTAGSKKDVYAIILLGSDSRDSDTVKLLDKIK